MQIDWKALALDLAKDTQTLRRRPSDGTPPLSFFFETEPLRSLFLRPAVCRYSPCSKQPVRIEEVTEVAVNAAVRRATDGERRRCCDW